MKLSLKNIGKIRTGTFEIKGITVIAGKNNTGKTTVSRALFSMFEGFYKTKRVLRDDIKSNIINNLKFFQLSEKVDFDIDSKVDDLIDDITAKGNVDRKYVEEFLHRFELDPLLKEKDHFNLVVSTFLRLLVAVKDLNGGFFNYYIGETFRKEFRNQINGIYDNSEGNVKLEIKRKCISIDFKDDEVIRLDDDRLVINHKVQYIDDPFVLDHWQMYDSKKYVGPLHRQVLVKQFKKSRTTDSITEQYAKEGDLKQITQRLNAVCPGNVASRNGAFYYQEENQRAKLNLQNISTGLKTFVILKKLLGNGAIVYNGTIILDEPEIHLHPEWQLRFAELVVLLQQAFNLHILMTTHSPYFLRAIQVYSMKYAITDRVKYYLLRNHDEQQVHDVTNKVDWIYEELAQSFDELDEIRWAND